VTQSGKYVNRSGGIEGIWLSGKTLETADPGIASSTPPLTPTKITFKKEHRVSVLYTGDDKESGLSCVVGAPVSCTIGD